MKLLALLFLLLTTALARAQFTYVTNNDNTITITAYTGPGGDVTIPAAINGVPVSIIGNNAFFGTSVTNVIIPSGVTEIGLEAFADCTSLATVAIPSTVTNIGQATFQDCIALTNVLIPPGLTEIQSETFLYCSSLQNITIPDSVVSIDSEAFAEDAGLTNILIPDSVTNLEAQTFYGCTSLTNVTIGGGVAGIGYESFAGCTNLITIQVNATNSFFSSVDGVLLDSSQTTILQFPEGKGGIYPVPNSVTNIGVEAFADCARLTGITIPDNVTTIGASAFDSCINLSSIVLPNSVTGIAHDTFNFCVGLTNVVMPGVGDIGMFAFDGCASLTHIVIPGNVTSIDGEAFENCSGLTSVTICGDPNISDDFVFAECTSLQSIFFASNPPDIYFFYTYDNFFNDPNVTAYYLPGMAGWSSLATNADTIPIAQWLPQIQTSDASFGIQTNQFGFNISWASGQNVIVDACTNLSNPNWQPVQTNTLAAGTAYFSDPQWASYSARFYRLRSP